ncbi:chemokine-like receptor 1 [Pygocentrus nattereri]|uniref:chemokine-like receptor 1 n=1 Tax=Pygocentrus nattereri TaxID=42514 RepID=UPI00081465DA|nr:chemokine-like receptor 1 [Pygocentrus nattereri]
MNSTQERGQLWTPLDIFYTVTNVIIFILGVGGNGLVIWIAGFKMKRSVIRIWYLSLAVSDFLFCTFLPLNIIYIVTHEWILGVFLCKLMFFSMYFNWFSSIFLLVIISVDRCVVVMFPVWAQNKRTVRKALVIVMIAWIISAAYCMPSAISLEVQQDDHQETKLFFYNYSNNQELTADVTCDFIIGFVIPFLLIVICYVVIIRKLKPTQMTKSKKPFKIMTALVATFFTCWLPYHIFALMELNYKKYDNFLITGATVVLILANASSCLNPLLYAFMGKDFKRQCYSLLTKIENAIEGEEDKYTLRGTGTTSTGESKLATGNNLNSVASFDQL